VFADDNADTLAAVYLIEKNLLSYDKYDEFLAERARMANVMIYAVRTGVRDHMLSGL
jgi:hypothetical protein